MAPMFDSTTSTWSVRITPHARPCLDEQPIRHVKTVRPQRSHIMIITTYQYTHCESWQAYHITAGRYVDHNTTNNTRHRQEQLPLIEVTLPGLVATMLVSDETYRQSASMNI